MKPELTFAEGPVRAFAPASVSNVGPGFDVFGFAVEGAGDVVTASWDPLPGRAPGASATATSEPTSSEPASSGLVSSLEVSGDGGRLPTHPQRNTAAVAAARLLESLGIEDRSVHLQLAKGLPLASGLGSSAASAAAAVTAVHHLVGAPLEPRQLLPFVVAAEEVACGAAHADNAAPSLLGGFLLVRGRREPRVDSLPVPEGLCCALLRPHLAVSTGEARALLGQRVDLEAAITQWGNAAALAAGLCTGDADLLASALEDRVAEPVRQRQVPGFQEVKTAALSAGALGAGLSGSGPTIFSLTFGSTRAGRIAEAMREAFQGATGLDGETLVSPVQASGARVLASGESPPPPLAQEGT
ncbi:MAG: homoserine kinase [Acidobacteriota bacterium]